MQTSMIARPTGNRANSPCPTGGLAVFLDPAAKQGTIPHQWDALAGTPILKFINRPRFAKLGRHEACLTSCFVLLTVTASVRAEQTARLTAVPVRRY